MIVYGLYRVNDNLHGNLLEILLECRQPVAYLDLNFGGRGG